MYDFDLSGKVILLTGATGLLGSVYAEYLVKNNASLILCDIDLKKTQELAKKIGDKDKNNVIGLFCDVGDKTSVNECIDEGYKKFGRITSVVNNAAATGEFLMKKGELFTDFADFNIEMWDATIKTNLTGSFLVAQAAEKYLIENGGGSVINISSTYGVVGPDHRIYEDLPFNCNVAYATSKAGVHGLTRWLSTYWGKHNIRVNTLVPGGVLNNHDELFISRYSERTPLHRMANKEDMPGMIIYLLSDMSQYCTGQQYFVDGGWTAM